MSLALAGRFLTTAPPGKPKAQLFSMEIKVFQERDLQHTFLFIHLFIQQTSEYLLFARYCRKQNPCSHGTYTLMGETDDAQVNIDVPGIYMCCAQNKAEK